MKMTSEFKIRGIHLKLALLGSHPHSSDGAVQLAGWQEVLTRLAASVHPSHAAEPKLGVMLCG